eukprot:2455360-Rhodomonas_salina.1
MSPSEDANPSSSVRIWYNSTLCVSKSTAKPGTTVRFASVPQDWSRRYVSRQYRAGASAYNSSYTGPLSASTGPGALLHRRARMRAKPRASLLHRL